VSSGRPSSYLFALVDGGGTVPPELGAVERLVERGHHVEVLADDSMINEVRATGAIFRPWMHSINPPGAPNMTLSGTGSAEHPLQLFTRLLDRVLAGPAPHYAADVLSAVDAHPPHRIVCSTFAVGAMVGAQAACVAYDVLMPNIYALPTPGLPTFGLGGQPSVGPLGRGRDQVVTALVQRQWNKGLGPINQLRNSLGLSPIDDFWDQVRQARKILVLTSQSFDFPAELPDNVHYVGPVLDDPNWAKGQPWALPAGEHPIVLVAMSSTFQDQTDCIERVIDGLATLPIRGIVTVGPALDPTTFRARGNVSIVSAAPHSEVLKYAGVVVTHGGHGTVVRALAAGVPLVVMPHGRDQADNAARVTSRGAGVSISRHAQPATIAAAVSRVTRGFSEDLCRSPAHERQSRPAKWQVPRCAADRTVIGPGSQLETGCRIVTHGLDLTKCPRRG
jgi:UDP:flavonoid glycosyltransferase YjiC (YdhE family)